LLGPRNTTRVDVKHTSPFAKGVLNNRPLKGRSNDIREIDTRAWPKDSDSIPDMQTLTTNQHPKVNTPYEHDMLAEREKGLGHSTLSTPSRCRDVRRTCQQTARSSIWSGTARRGVAS
jgi:hypothetical protein